MRRIHWIGAFVLLASGGCQTVEVAVDYPLPMASVHVVAKFQARDSGSQSTNKDSAKEKSVSR